MRIYRIRYRNQPTERGGHLVNEEEGCSPDVGASLISRVLFLGKAFDHSSVGAVYGVTWGLTWALTWGLRFVGVRRILTDAYRGPPAIEKGGTQRTTDRYVWFGDGLGCNEGVVEIRGEISRATKRRSAINFIC